MSRQAKSFALPVLAGIGVLAGAHFLRPPLVPLGGQIGKEIARVEAERPAILLIGNSYLAAAVDAVQLSRATGRRCMFLKRPGSASACWYLMLKNVLRPARHVPQAVLVYFLDNDLTLPAFRTGGRDRTDVLEPLSTAEEHLLERLAYRRQKGLLLTFLENCWPLMARREQIKKNIERRVEETALSLLARSAGMPAERIFNRVFAARLMNAQRLGRRQLQEEMAKFDTRDTFDFPGQVQRSFLPQMIALAQAKGCRLVLVRHRCRYHAEGVPESAALKEYMAHLRRYLAERKIPLLDFSRERSIRLEHFDSGDHFKGERMGFTRMLSDRLVPRLPPAPDRSAIP